ncbi:MAG TPA: ribose-5-phosphate isomerase RpiA [bacterium]|nr:ribose-5-phosphate isomerase RpiA [bacterium]
MTTAATDPRDRFKEAAALRAVSDEVRDGMVVGLGTGSTVAFVLRELGRLVQERGWRLRGVPTSERTATEARRLGIALTTLDDTPDIVLDGADQVDPALHLVKGGGGAHVREKVVALSARRVAIVADFTKSVERLRGPIPLEVLPFALPWVLRALPNRIPGCVPAVRLRDGQPARSDNGNLLVDLACGPLDDPGAVAAALDGVSGVVDHGLFIGVADVVYLAGPEGLRRMEAVRRTP